MTIPFFSLRPLRILADRSRDISCGWTAVRLIPGSIFLVTDNQSRRLTASLLSRYDVLSIAGIGGAPRYSKAELDAIDLFVRRGGTLLLASNAGQYTLRTGRPSSELVQQAVAARFGYEFPSSDALATNLDGVRGFDRSELRLTRAGTRVGLKVGDLPLDRPGGLSVPGRATVLVRAGRAGRPVIACSVHGKGKVLACHDTLMFSGWNGFAMAHFLAIVDPAGRVQSAGRPVAVLERPATRSDHGAIVLTFSEATRAHEQRVLRLARRVLEGVMQLAPGKRFQRWRIGLEAGSGCWTTGWWPNTEVESYVGVWQSDASLVTVLASQLCTRVLYARFGRELRTMVGAMVGFVVDRVLRSLGFVGHADHLAEAVKGHPTAAERVDFSRVYSEVELPPSLRRLWFELSDAFGEDLLRRVCLALPKEDPWRHIDFRLYSEFDALAFVLARAAGKQVYRRLRRWGHTVREIPLAKPASRALGTAIDRSLARLLEDPREPASDRFDAASILAVRLRDGAPKAGFAPRDIERALESVSVRRSLPTALLLWEARDARGRDALRRQLRNRDAGLRAIAALSLVSGCGEARAADVLRRVARQCDTRFQLAAGYALRLAGYADGKSLSFEGHPGCRMQVRVEAQVRATPVVDGYEVANVYATPMVRPTSHGAGFSVYYVDWVHTAPRWRRRGLARTAMDACLGSRWDTECAATSLHTGIRNVAHTLYRQFGLSDYHRAPFFEKALREEPRVRPPAGVTIRPARADEWVQLIAFMNRCTRARPDEAREPGAWSHRFVAFAAYQRRRPVGLVVGILDEDRKAWLDHVAIGPPPAKRAPASRSRTAAAAGADPREQLGLALLSTLHAELRRRGLRTVRAAWWRPGDPETAWLLRRSGYGSRPEGLVELFRINSLAQLLREALPAFQNRLSSHGRWASWSGTIALRAPKQRAVLCCRRGKLGVEDEKRGVEPSIVLRGELPALERVVLGVSSAFEAYLQTEIEAVPMLTETAAELLDTLFPRLALET